MPADTAPARPAHEPPPPATGVAAELTATRVVAALSPSLRRMPFTLAVLAVTLLLGLVSRAIVQPAWRMDWFTSAAYGVPALREGKVWTLVTGLFFARVPAAYLSAILLFALLVGPCEVRLGTWRTAAAAIVGAVGGILVASLLVLGLAQTQWGWAHLVANAREVGFGTGALAVVAVTSATLHSPWRLRVRVVLVFSVTIAFLFEGSLSDVAHLVAVPAGLWLGQRYLSVEEGFGPRTRREARLITSVALVAIAAVEVVMLVFPGDGPLGSTAGDAGSVADVVLDVMVIGVVAYQLRFGRRWAWWVAVVQSGFNVIAAGAVLALLLAGQPVPSAPVSLGTGLLWLVVLVLLLFNRRAFRVPRHRVVVGGVPGGGDVTERAKSLLRQVGGSTTSWMTTWPEMRYSFTSDDRGYVGYQRHAGVALVLGDPIVPPETLGSAVAEFTAVAERGGLAPCLFSVTQPVAEAARAHGWRAVQIAEDTLIDLPGLTFTGKAWQHVRSAQNRATREGIDFRLTTLADEPFVVLAQVRAVSEQWVGDKGLPEMGFTLGGVEEALDRDVRVGLAFDRDGSLHGVTSWLPVFGPAGVIRGWTLDVMRRRPDGFKPVMEYMIAGACAGFRDAGAQVVSLSGAPLARADQPGQDAEKLAQLDRVLDAMGAALEPLYGFRSLHAFKAKFQPRYEPMYLAFRDESDLPRLGIALTRAYLPDATPRQLIKAGLAGRG
ncbi:MAG: bifunctional lysylphosphatidylglycerol flippase/synthetase MprF [Dermatophilaceae bacterium]